MEDRPALNLEELHPKYEGEKRMDAGKRARIARIVGFVCLGLALLNATFAVLAMVADEKVSGGNLAVAASLLVIGIVNLNRARRRTPPDA